MGTNPFVPQGQLNKLRGSFSCISFPQLNVTNSFLDREGIGLSFQGEMAGYLPTLTGAVVSPNPYVIGMVTLHLLKTQSFINLWKSQWESAVSIGDVNITTDAPSPGLSDFPLINCVIQNVEGLIFDGSTAGLTVTVVGTYYINNTLY